LDVDYLVYAVGLASGFKIFAFNILAKSQEVFYADPENHIETLENAIFYPFICRYRWK